MIEILQEEWDSISHFLDDFGKEDCSDLEDISKKKKFFEKEINLIEKEICFILDNINIVALEQYVSAASQDSSPADKMAETKEIPAEEAVA